jgi:hypothetical protein
LLTPGDPAVADEQQTPADDQRRSPVDEGEPLPRLPGRWVNARSTNPASTNRADDISNAGIVSLATWIVRYVEPQMTYTAAKAITI